MGFPPPALSRPPRDVGYVLLGGMFLLLNGVLGNSRLSGALPDLFALLNIVNYSLLSASAWFECGCLSQAYHVSHATAASFVPPASSAPSAPLVAGFVPGQWEQSLWRVLAPGFFREGYPANAWVPLWQPIPQIAPRIPGAG